MISFRMEFEITYTCGQANKERVAECFSRRDRWANTAWAWSNASRTCWKQATGSEANRACAVAFGHTTSVPRAVQTLKLLETR